MSELDLTLLAVLSRGLAAAVFVGGVIALMERASPFIGGIVLALPIVTAPAYLFLLPQHSPAFIAEAALASLATVGAVLLFITVVIALVRHLAMPFVLMAALAAWLATGLVTSSLPSHLAVSLAIPGLAAVIAWIAGRGVAMTAPAARSRSPAVEIVLRGAAAGGLVVAVGLLAHTTGPQVAGIFSSFPVALMTVCWFLPRRLETAGIRAAMRAAQIGMASHVPFFLSLGLLAPEVGSIAAFVFGLAGALAVALLLAVLRRRHLAR